MPLYLQSALGYTAIQAGSAFLPIGIMQGIAAPLAGVFSEKSGPRLPILVGTFLLAFSFYLNYFFSWLTEHSFIMLTLYLRGIAMGLMFSPLTAVATFDVPRDKMGQASGLINVLRQVGGSFGVALMTTFLTSRIVVHAQHYGETIDVNSPVFTSTLRNIGNFVVHQAGSFGQIAEQQSRYLLFSNLNKQAFVQGVADDFLLAAIITFISALPVFFLRLKKKNKPL
jgi:DHA2 family multidrug resistance protein